MPLSKIFQLYRGCLFYWWRKPEDLEKTSDLSQVTEQKIYLPPQGKDEILDRVRKWSI
jgi:hypothetical protein